MKWAHSGVSPRISWQSQYDDNVFRSAVGEVSDVIMTIGTNAGVRGRLPRVGLTASGGASWVHYSRLEEERGANVTGGVRLDFLLNRITPYVSIEDGNSRHRQNLEVDTRPRIENATATVGGILHLGGKTFVDFSTKRGRERYTRYVTVDGVNLDEALSRTSDTVTMSLIQSVTPVTRLQFTGEMDRAQFDSSPSKNADSVRLTLGFASDGRITEDTALQGSGR